MSDLTCKKCHLPVVLGRTGFVSIQFVRHPAIKTACIPQESAVHYEGECNKARARIKKNTQKFKVLEIVD